MRPIEDNLHSEAGPTFQGRAGDRINQGAERPHAENTARLFFHRAGRGAGRPGLARCVGFLHIARVTFSAASLLLWYDHHRRIMPWRALPGQKSNPYHVWLSEIMLQQTTVVTVHDYFLRFIARFPSVQALAAAPQHDVLTAWAGLGYYSRARNLHLCARELAARGAFPQTVPALEALPGIGPYTARAIASIAFNVPVIPVDGNVERVTARLFAVGTPLPAGKKHLATLAATLNDDAPAQARASDFAQALFDLGATICTPRRPKCMLCPWQQDCAAHRQGKAEFYPVKTPKKQRPDSHGTALIIRGPGPSILLRKRPDKGLLAAMMALPGSDWISVSALPDIPRKGASAGLWMYLGRVKHVFTHLTLYLDVYEVEVTSWNAVRTSHLAPLMAPEMIVDAVPCAMKDLPDQALPSLMRKCLALVELPA